MHPFGGAAAAARTHPLGHSVVLVRCKAHPAAPENRERTVNTLEYENMTLESGKNTRQRRSTVSLCQQDKSNKLRARRRHQFSAHVTRRRRHELAKFHRPLQDLHLDDGPLQRYFRPSLKIVITIIIFIFFHSTHTGTSCVTACQWSFLYKDWLRCRNKTRYRLKSLVISTEASSEHCKDLSRDNAGRVFARDT